MRVVENQIFERNQVAVEPQAGAAVGKMGPGDPARLDRAAAQPFIETGEQIPGGGERSRQSGPGERVGEHISVAIYLITLIRNDQPESNTLLYSVIAVPCEAGFSPSIISDYRLEPPALPCPALASRNRSRGGLLPLESGWRDRG